MTSRPRKGYFIEYQGRECGFFENKGIFYVFRHDEEALSDGFVEATVGIFQKPVLDSDLEADLFSIDPFVIYRGTEFAVMKVYYPEDILTIVESDKTTAKRLKMLPIDRDIYALNIAFDEMQGYREERTVRNKWWTKKS